MMRKARFALTFALATLVPLAIWSCSSDETSESPGDTVTGTYRGLMTGAKETGVLDVTLGGGATPANAHPLAGGSPVSGTMTLVGGEGPVSLTGSYDPATGTLTLTASTSSGTYSLTGTSSGAGFQGAYSGPNGSGHFSLASAASGSVEVYCGTYGETADAPEGVWNLLVDANGHVTGAHCDTSECGVLTGTVQNGTLTVGDPDDSGIEATGTIGGGVADGTYPGGVFHGSTSACGSVVGDAGSDVTSIPDDAGDDAGPTLETLVTGLNDPVSIALDATHVYWLSGADAAIRRCPLAGCASPETVASGLSVPTSIAVSGSSIYWTNGFRYLMTCTVGADGACAAAPTQFADLGGTVYPAHLSVQGTRLYWVLEQGSSRVLETCPLVGCSAGYPKSVYASAAGAPFDGAALAGLTLDDAHAYVTSFTGGLFRVTLTDPETSDAASATKLQDTPYTTGELDRDGTTLRFGVLGDGRVASCTAPDCATLTDFVTGHAAPGGVRADATHVYGFDRGTSNGSGGYVAGTGTIWRVAK